MHMMYTCFPGHRHCKTYGHPVGILKYSISNCIVGWCIYARKIMPTSGIPRDLGGLGQSGPGQGNQEGDKGN